MGEIADDHESLIMDELEAMERMGSCELYEKYGLTGSETLSGFSNSSHYSGPHRVTCNFCGEGGFVWGGPRHARRLYKNGQAHYCLKRRAN